MRIANTSMSDLLLTALAIAAVVFAVKDGPFQDTSLVLIGITLAAVFVFRVDGPWKNDEGRVHGWIGVLLIGALALWGFMLLRGASNPCIEYARSEDGGECVLRSDDR